MSALGRWAPFYEGATEQAAYGYHSPTYQAAADWLRPCRTVEDWGAGYGWFGRYLHPSQTYLPIDGTPSRWVDRVVDLVEYRSDPRPDGILLRHVLEHSHDWAYILDNAVASFRHRMVVVTFTPPAAATHDLGDDTSGLDAPTYAFRTSDVLALMGGLTVAWREYAGPKCGHYGIERVYLLERSNG